MLAQAADQSELGHGQESSLEFEGFSVREFLLFLFGAEQSLAEGVEIDTLEHEEHAVGRRVHRQTQTHHHPQDVVRMSQQRVCRGGFEGLGGGWSLIFYLVVEVEEDVPFRLWFGLWFCGRLGRP